MDDFDPEWYEEEYFTAKPYAPYYTIGEPAPLSAQKFIVLMNVTQPRSVLDVGCAYGLMVERCLENGIYAMGLDISKWCEKQAEIIIPGHFVRGVAWDLPFKDKEFDVLYCDGVLEHIPERLIEQTLSEFYRVANKRCMDITFDHPETEHHICNHNFDWWFERCPPNTWLSKEGNTFDQGIFVFKDAI